MCARGCAHACVHVHVCTRTRTRESRMHRNPRCLPPALPGARGWAVDAPGPGSVRTGKRGCCLGVCRHPHLGLRQQGTESLVGESVQEPGAGRRGEGAPGRGSLSGWPALERPLGPERAESWAVLGSRGLSLGDRGVTGSSCAGKELQGGRCPCPPPPRSPALHQHAQPLGYHTMTQGLPGPPSLREPLQPPEP